VRPQPERDAGRAQYTENQLEVNYFSFADKTVLSRKENVFTAENAEIAEMMSGFRDAQVSFSELSSSAASASLR